MQVFKLGCRQALAVGKEGLVSSFHSANKNSIGRTGRTRLD